jgi:RNA polymerase-binding transcription factor DksA
MPPTTSSAPRHSALRADQLSLFRTLLEQQWRQQLDAVVRLSYDALDEGGGHAGDGSRPVDVLLGSQLLAAARQQLQDTEDALVRLEDGTYGTCTGCGGPVSAERLEVLPGARFCIDCQTLRTAR